MNDKPDQVITKDGVLKLLEDERLNRERAASHEINEILKRYNCEIDALVTFGSHGRVSTQINITARSVLETDR